jgi:hypothetical protein
MAYNDLQNNQTVSFTNLQSGVSQGIFTAKTTIPSSNRQVTKAQVDNYININTSLPSYVAKASNKLITKGDLSGITSTSSYILYGVAGNTAYKSIDGGTTFTALPGLTADYSWIGIAGDSSGNYIAVISNSLNLGVYISTDGGATFSARLISGVFGGNFYPTGVAMSNNGQYIGISGLTNLLNAEGDKQALLVASSNYGSSFGTIYTDSMNVNMYKNYPFKISVSGNGQYMTAIYSYQVQPPAAWLNNPRPWSFRIYSTNYGDTWTRSSGSEFTRFLDIALDGTGQNQFLTADYLKPGIFDAEGIKAFVTNNFGAGWSERYSFTVSYYSGDLRKQQGFVSATISDNGQVMVGATNQVVSTPNYVNMPSTPPLVIRSFNSGNSFTPSFGWTNCVQIAGGTAVTTGITNNYIAMMLNNIGQFNYSKTGGENFIPKATTARAWNQIYRKALIYNPNNYPAAGTFIDSVCVNCDLYAIRADGNGGSYQAEVIQYNTEVCCFGGPGGGGGGGGGDVV